MSDTRVNVTPNLAFGICLVVIGTALALERLHVIEASQILRFWPLGLVLIGVSLVIQALHAGDAPPAGRSEQGFTSGHVVAIVLVGILVSQSLHRGTDAIRTDSSETVSVFAVLGRHERVSHAPRFRGGEMTTVMGRSELDLREATIPSGEEAVIDVFGLMGRVVVRVPEGWTVDVRAVPIMGGVRDRRGGVRDVPGNPRVVLRGFIMMGGLDIRS